ncbi:MAG: ATP-binding protein [Acidobacteriota bacterium]|jgi:NadR type nicotinamide-nucleotide adenylyltransferase
MIRVVATGSECTGKTTLAAALASHYETDWVPEYVRHFVEEKGDAPVYEDVDAIARGQIALEDEHIARLPRVLVQDADLLSTVVYSNHYYGDCPSWIEGALRGRAADLYLLCDIDVPWVPDGDQRDRGDRRDQMHALFRDALKVRSLPFVEVAGDHGSRLATAVAAVDALIMGSGG